MPDSVRLGPPPGTELLRGVEDAVLGSWKVTAAGHAWQPLPAPLPVGTTTTHPYPNCRGSAWSGCPAIRRATHGRTTNCAHVCAARDHPGEALPHASSPLAPTSRPGEFPRVPMPPRPKKLLPQPPEVAGDSAQ